MGPGEGSRGQGDGLVVVPLQELGTRSHPPVQRIANEGAPVSCRVEVRSMLDSSVRGVVLATCARRGCKHAFDPPHHESRSRVSWADLTEAENLEWLRESVACESHVGRPNPQAMIASRRDRTRWAQGRSAGRRDCETPDPSLLCPEVLFFVFPWTDFCTRVNVGSRNKTHVFLRIPREEDGAIEFWRLKDDLRNKFEYPQYWSDDVWKSKMAGGGSNKKRFYCTVNRQGKKFLKFELFKVIQEAIPLSLLYRTMY